MPAAHQAVPEAVDDRPREPAVVRVVTSAGELLEPLRRGCVGVDRAELGEEEPRPRPSRPVGLSQRWISSGLSAMTAASP